MVVLWKLADALSKQSAKHLDYASVRVPVALYDLTVEPNVNNQLRCPRVRFDYAGPADCRPHSGLLKSLLFL